MAMTILLRVFWLFIFLACVTLQPAFAHGRSTSNFSSEIAALKASLSDGSRIKYLERIVAIAKDGLEIKVEPDDVMVISSLLDSSNLEIVHFSAVALGNIGAQAAVSIPALERNLKRLDELEARMLVKPTQPFSTQIHVALMKIDGRIIPPM